MTTAKLQGCLGLLHMKTRNVKLNESDWLKYSISILLTNLIIGMIENVIIMYCYSEKYWKTKPKMVSPRNAVLILYVRLRFKTSQHTLIKCYGVIIGSYQPSTNQCEHFPSCTLWYFDSLSDNTVVRKELKSAHCV